MWTYIVYFQIGNFEAKTYHEIVRRKGDVAWKKKEKNQEGCN